MNQFSDISHETQSENKYSHSPSYELGCVSDVAAVFHDKETAHLFRVFGIPRKYVKGEGMVDILKSLILEEKYREKAHALLEICTRFHERRLGRGSQYSCSDDIFSHFKIRMALLNQEAFVVVYLNNKHQYIAETLLTIGTLNKSLVHPRETFSNAIAYRAAAVIFIHNHPSHDPVPSQEDIQVTRRLMEVGQLVGIPVLDHIIIGNGEYFSLADHSLL